MRTFRIAALVLTVLLCRAGGNAAETTVINLINLPADSSAQVYYAQDLRLF